MSILVSPWFAFVVLGIIILFAGPELPRSDDIVADRTGLSKNWVGIVLLSTITSFPELARESAPFQSTILPMLR